MAGRVDAPTPRKALFNIDVRTAAHIADSILVERDDLTALRIEMARFVGELLKDNTALI